MLNILIAILSLVILIKSAAIFLDQSVALANKIKISSFLIGFTLIALGTSLPDLVIGTYSTIMDHPEIAISTLIGSAIVKTSLILGVLALFTNYKLSKIDIKRNIPTNIIIMVVFFIILLVFGFQMPWIVGIISLLLLLFSILFARKNNHTITIEGKVKFNILFLLLSFTALIISGKLCVDNVVIFTNQYGIADTVVGYFILAIGVSIPELVTSFTTIKKGNLQLALGSILGSNLIDILLVSGISSFFVTLDFKPFLIEFLFLMFTTTIFMLFAVLGKRYSISKKEGIGLILVYIIFIIIQWI